MNSIDIFSLQIDAVCLLVDLIIIVYLVKCKEQNLALYATVLVMAMLVVVFDIGARLSVDNRCSSFYSNDMLCDKINTFFIVFAFGKYIFYFALVYSAAMLAFFKGSSSIAKRYLLVLGSIPFLLTVYLVISSVFDGRVLILTYNGVLIKGPYFFVVVSIIGLYSIIGVFYSLSILDSQKEKLAEITYYRWEYVIFYVAIALPFLMATVGCLFDYPIVSPVFVITFTYLMTIHQHLRLSLDELTSINNLNELRRYLDNLMQGPEKARRQTFMIFIDINRFKEINDSYGHNSGDVVLIQFSRLLKNIALSFNCFVCRYAGDEFIMIKKVANEEKASSICRYIEYSLSQLKELSLAPYDLSVSTGFTRFDRRFKSTQEFIDAADKLMYETKRYAHKDYTSIFPEHRTSEIGKRIFKYGEKKKRLDS